MKKLLEKSFEEHEKVLKSTYEDLDNIMLSGNMIIETLKNNNKIIIAGNGGSAGDSQHFSAELVGRFLKDRRSLPCIALTTDTSALTAISNDYGYEKVFLRQIEGLSKPNDLFIGISTSGNSESINLAAEYCKNNNIQSIGLLGRDGGYGASIFDKNIIIQSSITANIQEMHILVLHLWCMMIDESFN